jgi:hypothetical protein
MDPVADNIPFFWCETRTGGCHSLEYIVDVFGDAEDARPGFRGIPAQS